MSQPTTTGPAAPFRADTFQNEFLPAGADTVDAVVTVTAAGDPTAVRSATAPGDRAEVIIIDTSGSMGSGRKLQAAKAAAVAAVELLDDGVEFAVVAGTHEARMVWPVDGRALDDASAADRATARRSIERLPSEGGTAIGTWLDAAKAIFSNTSASYRHAILLTDGRNESQTPHELAAAVAACRGLFQCDCRGVGTDWDVSELRTVATALLGTVDIVADPEDLAADFAAMMDSSQARALPDVRLRLWAPQGATLESVRQVAPEVRDLTASATTSGPLTNDFLLGGWAPGEVRDYHLRIQVKPGGLGDEMLAGRVSLVVGDEVVTQALVRAVWTDDQELSTRMDRHVAHYTGQVELADAIQAGLAAAKTGDDRTATVKLGRALQLAKESGHDDTLRLLKQVIEVTDEASGTVRLKPKVGKAEEMTLDTRSTRTVRLGKGKPKPPAEPAEPGAGA